MTSGNSFEPQWASPPGDTIAAILHKKKIDIASFAGDMGGSEDDAHSLLRGTFAINRAVAERLRDVVGGSVSFWLNREAQYRDDLARLHKIDESKTAAEWLKELPIRDMASFGWITRFADKDKQAKECLRFFAEPSLPSWHLRATTIRSVVAFRTTNAFRSSPGAVAAWLRQGEILSSAMSCDPWDAEKFRSYLREIRKLTRIKEPSVFLPRLQQLCAACGVAIIFVRAPQGCRASGATKFLSNYKALILLSFRYRTDDHFWFTFFHEAGHLLLHDHSALFIEGANLLSTAEEEEADIFSEQLLVPAEYKDELFALPLDHRKIMRFAKRIGIAPGIVVGQLQHAGQIGRNRMNFLKQRYEWV